jgi:hypothetical protein
MYMRTMRYLSALAAAVLCAAVLATYGSSAAPARRTIDVPSTDTVTPRVAPWHTRTFSGEEPKDCVRSPARLPPSIAPEGGATLTVPVGRRLCGVGRGRGVPLLARGHKASPTGLPMGCRPLVGPPRARGRGALPEQGGVHAAGHGLRLPRAAPWHGHAHSSYRPSLEACQAGATSRPAPLSRDCDRGQLSVGTTILSRFV